jgi:hypothetical protein
MNLTLSGSFVFTVPQPDVLSCFIGAKRGPFHANPFKRIYILTCIYVSFVGKETKAENK